jgi:signal transduction histidine kinase
VLPDAPAIVVPIQRAFVASERPDAAGVVRRSGALDFQEVLVEFRSHRDVLVVALDASHLRETMLRALAERHFPEQGAERYHVSIVDGSSAPVLTRGVPDGEVIPLDRADVAVPFFGIRIGRMSLTSSSPSAHVMAWTITRPDGTRRAAEPSETPAPGSSRNLAVILDERMVADAGTAVATARLRSPAMRVAEEGWQVRLQHADGSLEAAVANARARNLWLSFGMLALLVASAGLVVVNAQRSERLAARQMDFVATVSHELRTPLAVIRSAAQNLQAGVVLGHEQARRYGDLIEDEGRRLTDMVEQVLEYAGLSGNRQALRAQAVDVRSLVDEALESCRARLEDGRFEVSVAVPADLPPVMGDADALRRALQNLIANAVKYAADGRWLGVRAELTPRGAREVRLSVSDHGRGIEADDLPHIFEPFYRGRYAQERQIHGNGLGLSLVKRIADVHSGRLTASSTPGEGATFTLHLPVATGTPEPDVLGAAAPEARGRSI